MPTEIAWSDETWNPTVGCSRVSPGCDGCYAIGVAHRAMQPAHEGLTWRRPSERGFGEFDTDWTGEVRLLPDRLDTPLQWRKPRRVFVDSMSDLFHPDVPDEFIAKVFATMTTATAHTFQVLTKRPQRMAKWMQAVSRSEGGWLTHNGSDPTSCGGTGEIIPVRDEFARVPGETYKRRVDGPWPLPNVWLGTSVENQRYADLRIPHLLATPAAVRFLSIEPLLGPVDLHAPGVLGWRGARGVLHPDYRSRIMHENLRDAIDWVIIGGESGPGARPMEREWAQDIVDQCHAAGVPVFVKQLGSVLGGKQHQDIETFPEGLRVREWPTQDPDR